jgi:P pilus assembly chaperone PapD
LSASTLSFASSSTRTVTYTNNTSTKVTFIQASMSSGKYGQSNNCDEVLPGASCTSTITYYSGGSGATTATFTMTSTAPNSPHLVALTTAAVTTPTTPSAPTTGNGVTLSATSLDFTAASPTRSVTYTNNTGAKVTFIQASMSSGKFGQSNNCDEVQPGASCTSTITYYPGGSGGNTATFTMTSTASNSAHVVTLKGSASKPRIVG